MNKTLTITVTGCQLRKWDYIKTHSNGGTAIVIKTKPGVCLDTITCYPYSQPKNKFSAFFKFQWLRIRLFLKII